MRGFPTSRMFPFLRWFCPKAGGKSVRKYPEVNSKLGKQWTLRVANFNSENSPKARSCVWIVRMKMARHPWGLGIFGDTTLMEGIRRPNHLGWCYNLVNHSINYQPQLVFSPDLWTINSRRWLVEGLRFAKFWGGKVGTANSVKLLQVLGEKETLIDDWSTSTLADWKGWVPSAIRPS